MTNPTLQETHTQLKIEIDEQLNRIAAAVESNGDGERIDWGNVGDLSYMLAKLKEIASHK